LLDNLRTSLWRLRKALRYRAWLDCLRNDDIVLDVAAFDIDALAFRRLAAQGAASSWKPRESLRRRILDGLRSTAKSMNPGAARRRRATVTGPSMFSPG